MSQPVQAEHAVLIRGGVPHCGYCDAVVDGTVMDEGAGGWHGMSDAIPTYSIIDYLITNQPCGHTLIQRAEDVEFRP